jgi:hypothetical protein
LGGSQPTVIVTWPLELPPEPEPDPLPPPELHAAIEIAPMTASPATAACRRPRVLLRWLFPRGPPELLPILFMGTFYVDGPGLPHGALPVPTAHDVATLTLHLATSQCNI